jgi:hypothetical protein
MQRRFRVQRVCRPPAKHGRIVPHRVMAKQGNGGVEVDGAGGIRRMRLRPAGTHHKQWWWRLSIIRGSLVLTACRNTGSIKYLAVAMLGRICKTKRRRVARGARGA